MSPFRFHLFGSTFSVPPFRFHLFGSTFSVPPFRFHLFGSTFSVPPFRFHLFGSTFSVPPFRFPTFSVPDRQRLARALEPLHRRLARQSLCRPRRERNFRWQTPLTNLRGKKTRRNSDSERAASQSPPDHAARRSPD